MFPALMSMLGSMGGSAAGGAMGSMAGGATNLGMGAQAAGGQMPMSADYQMGDYAMGGMPIGGDIGGQGNMGFSAPQSQAAEKDFMGVMQQGVGQAQPQMQPLPQMQEDPYQTPQYYRPAYGLMGY